MSKNKRTNYEIKPRLGVNLYLCVDSTHRFIDVFLDTQGHTSFLPGDSECHRGLLCKADAMYFCFFALTGQAEQRNAEEGYGNEDI